MVALISHEFSDERHLSVFGFEVTASWQSSAKSSLEKCSSKS